MTDHIFRRLLLSISYLLLIFSLKAQNEPPQRITLNAQNPTAQLRAYIHHFEADTLWMISDWSAGNNSKPQAYVADRIFSLELPEGPTKRGSHAGAGFIIGAALGLVAGIAINTGLKDSPFRGSSTSSASVSDYATITLIGGLGGGLIGALIPKRRDPTSRLRIEGSRDRLNAQRARLQQLQIQQLD